MVIEQHMHSDLAIPPGEYLEEVISALGMTKDELARRMDRPAPKLSAIFKGHKAITPDTALRLEKVVGVPAHIWTGLEAEYRLALARIQDTKEHERLKAEARFVTRYRYAELVRMGIVEKHTRPADKVLALQIFFGVTSLETVPSLRRYQPAFRSSWKATKGNKPEAIASWLRMGERAAARMHCAPFRRATLEKTVGTIRAMTRQPPERFQDALYKLLAASGIALVICPHMPSTGIHGATFWMGHEKAVIMMTIRYKWADIFWFSLYHELGHVLWDGCSTVVLEGKDGDTRFTKREARANRYAANTLIPAKAMKAFVDDGRYYDDDIQCFADRLGIDPGIVVGRLQNDGLLEPSWHNDLRKRFEWKK
ncbi:MAG: HigA family addiction module antidote protein [Deltaproteobacteria bacterium]|nr:HigA family addiction module antidote protein [Deltaproteobacteria bacterium]